MIFAQNGVVYEENFDENYIFFCDCSHRNHHIILTFWDWDNKTEDFFHSAYLYVPERHYQGFFGKLKSCFEYIFGSDLEYDSAMLRSNDLPKIIGLINDYNEKASSFAEKNNLKLDFTTNSEFGENQFLIKSSDGKRIVFERYNVFGKDEDAISCVVKVSMPKVSFFKKFSYIWDYLKYDGHYCEVELNADTVYRLSTFLKNFPVYGKPMA